VNKASSGFVENVLYQILEVSQKKLLSAVSSPTRSISLLYEQQIRTTYNSLLSKIIVNEIHNSQSTFHFTNKLDYDAVESAIDQDSNHKRYFIKKVYQEKPCESL